VRSNRAALAVGIVGLWIVGIAVMLNRNANRSEAQNLAEVALRVQPATFYYTIEHAGEQIGGASSALDTTTSSLISEEYFVGDYPVAKSLERTSARWQTRLSRGFRLADMNIDVARPTAPFAIHAAVQQDTTLFIIGSGKGISHSASREVITSPTYTPSLAPIAFMLGGPHRVGRAQQMNVFDPKTRTVLRPELAIRAESLFTVADSAMRDESGGWIVAHRDTVRAWKIAGAPDSVVVWVDSEGRLVAAAAGQYSATRTAFEIAFKNSKAR
jgi:hypothetical protein